MVVPLGVPLGVLALVLEVPEGMAQLVQVALEMVLWVLAGPVAYGEMALTALLAMLGHRSVTVGVQPERGVLGPEGHHELSEASSREFKGTLPQPG